MHTSESVSNMPLNEREAAITRINDPDRRALDRSTADQPHREPPIASDSVDAQPPVPLQPKPGDNWLSYFQQCSRLLIAVIDPVTLTLKYASDYFCQLTGIAVTGSEGGLGYIFQELLTDADNSAIQRLYRRHLIHRIFQQFYAVNQYSHRLLDEPVMISLQSPLYPDARYVEFWLRSEPLTIARLNPQLDEFADLELQTLTLPERMAMLTDPARFELLEQRLRLDNYQIEGWLLLEGLDVTDRESIRRITQLLIDRDSILSSQKFGELNHQMRSLFRAQNTLVLSIESDQVRLFMGSLGDEPDTRLYPLHALQQSHFMQAIRTNQVLVVPDLAEDPRTDGGRQLLAMGMRSLLLIPLIVPRLSDAGTSAPADQEAQRSENQKLEPSAGIDQPSTSPPSDLLHAIGVVALLSDRPHRFDALDCRHAEQLISAFGRALTAAQRQLVQQRFITNIHPAVEWRFLQEAERRSLGLPPETIVFTEVYPLYGISDIRGSSEERNRAIQADLLEQFHLGLAIVDAACNAKTTALGKQLRLDLLDRIQQMQDCVTVDAEVSQLRYLRDHLEIYFDYFAQCGAAAIAAIEAYRAACANEHECVYRARASYDETVGKINDLLRATWDRWQHLMQNVTPHYCDIEATDGIDHMIYAGKSIDPHFSRFQLRSLRYEQLRAVCDCARTAFQLQAKYNTSMQVTHLVLVQDATVDIFHNETTERLFDVRGSRDTRYEIVKKRIDKAIDEQTGTRITQPGMLTLVFCTDEEWSEYQEYFRYLNREGWVDHQIERGTVQPLQGVTGLRYARVRVLAQADEE